MGFLDKFKQGLKKTTQLLNTDIRDLFKSEGRLIDDQFLSELQEILIKTDLGFQASQQSVDEVRTGMRGRVVQMEDVIQTIKTKLRSLVAQSEEPIRFAAAKPTVIMVVGVNGSGKTTTIAKLTHLMKAQGK